MDFFWIYKKIFWICLGFLDIFKVTRVTTEHWRKGRAQKIIFSPGLGQRLKPFAGLEVGSRSGPYLLVLFIIV